MAANVFRQGYSTRTFSPYTMFPYREDNVGNRLRQFKFQTKSSNVTFNLRFNVNRVNFNSRLNEEFYGLLVETDNMVRYSRALVKEYQTSKRQFAFYILDCQMYTKMYDACNKRDLAAFQRHFNAEHGE